MAVLTIFTHTWSAASNSSKTKLDEESKRSPTVGQAKVERLRIPVLDPWTAKGKLRAFMERPPTLVDFALFPSPCNLQQSTLIFFFSENTYKVADIK